MEVALGVSIGRNIGSGSRGGGGVGGSINGSGVVVGFSSRGAVLQKEELLMEQFVKVQVPTGELEDIVWQWDIAKIMCG